MNRRRLIALALIAAWVSIFTMAACGTPTHEKPKPKPTAQQRQAEAHRKAVAKLTAYQADQARKRPLPPGVYEAGFGHFVVLPGYLQNIQSICYGRVTTGGGEDASVKDNDVQDLSVLANGDFLVHCKYPLPFKYRAIPRITKPSSLKGA